MDFEYTPEQQAFRREFRTWLEEHLPDRWLEGNHELPADFEERKAFLVDWHRQLFEGGWMGISWPEAYGGKGATLMEQVIYNQELARVNAPLMVNRVGILFVGPTLLEIGTDAQKEHFLPKILEGDSIWCQGFSEPNAGSDLANLQTRADRDGDKFVINGQKTWTSFAQYANWCFLLARTDASGSKHEGITAFLLPMDQDGVTVNPIRQIPDTQDFNEVFFDDAVVQEEHVIGGVGEGWNAAMTLLSFEHGLSELYLPDKLSLERRWEELVEYCQTHTRNGKPLSEHPEIRRRLADLDTKIQAAKITHLRHIQEQMAGEGSGAKGSINKVFSTELFKEMEDFALELLGPEASLWGDGFEEGRWPERYLESFGTIIAGGTSDIHRNIIGERVLGLPKDDKR